MLKRNLKAIVRQTLQISLVLMLLCVFVSAQKSRQTVSAEDYYQRGLVNVKNNKCFEAVDDFDKAIKLNPRDARFYEKRSECLPKDKALEDLNKAIELKPDFAEAYFRRGNHYFERFGDFEQFNVEDGEKALKDFNEAIELNPKNTEFFIARANLYLHLIIDPEKAFRDFDKVVELNPGNNEFLMMRASNYRKIGEYEKAISDCTAILKLKPRDFDGWSQRGFNYSSIGAYQKAIDDYNTAIIMKPEYAWQIFEKRAAAYRAVGSISLAEADEKSLEDYEKNNLFPPEEIPELSEKILTEQQLTDFYIESWSYGTEPTLDSGEKIKSKAKEEIIRLTKILKAYPRLDRGYFYRANNYAKSGEYDKAAADYTEAININPRNYLVFNNRGVANAKKGDYDAAIKDFSAALNLDPKDAEYLYNHGLALLNKGDAEKSAKDFTEYIKIYTKSSHAYRLRAKAYRKLGNTAEADADEKNAKRIEVENSVVNKK